MALTDTQLDVFANRIMGETYLSAESKAQLVQLIRDFKPVSKGDIIGEILNLPLTSIPSHTDVAGTASFSIVNGKLRYTPSTGTPSLVTLNIIDSAWDDLEIKFNVNICPVGGVTASTFGFRFGLYDTIPAAYSPNANGRISMGIRTTTSNPGSPYLSYLDATPTLVNGGAITDTGTTLEAGDEYEVTYRVKADGHSTTIKNLRNGQVSVATGLFNSDNNTLGNLPTVWKLFLNSGGGVFDFSNLKIKTFNPVNAKLAIIGDSLTDKSFATKINLAFAYRLKARLNGSVIVYGFPSFTSGDVLPYLQALIDAKPEYVYYRIGTNDARGNNSATTGSFATNTATIIAVLKAAGIKVIIGLVPPTAAGANNTNVNTINTALKQTYKLDKVLDINTLTQVGGVATTLYFNADLVHYNDAGHEIEDRYFYQSCPELFD